MPCPTVIFLKAQIRGGAATDLFATPVTVAPHVRDGKMVPGYTAIRHKAPAEAERGKPYQAYLLSEGTRAALARAIPPRYTWALGHHITAAYGVPTDAPPPPRPQSARVVGIADDGKGMEALVIELDGATRRPDGSTWHITWSKEWGRQPKESNAMLAEHGWRTLSEPIDLADLVPIVDRRDGGTYTMEGRDAPAGVVIVKPMPKSKKVPPPEVFDAYTMDFTGRIQYARDHTGQVWRRSQGKNRFGYAWGAWRKTAGAVPDGAHKVDTAVRLPKE